MCKNCPVRTRFPGERSADKKFSMADLGFGNPNYGMQDESGDTTFMVYHLSIRVVSKSSLTDFL